MSYVVDPADPTQPTDSQGATQGAEELRALKAYIATLAGLTGGQNLYRRNAVINGDMNIAQRGTNFAAVANSTYTLDRWLYEKTGAMVHTITQDTDVPTVAQAGRLFTHSLKIDCTTVDAAIAAGDYCIIGQCIEGYNFLPLAQRACYKSFWVKATKPGIYCASIRNSGADRSYPFEFTINTTLTWQQITIPVLASPSAGTWDYTTGVGARLYIALAAGSTFQGTHATWATGNFFATANQVNGCDDTANNFWITGVQLEAGAIATPFEQKLITASLADCKRYCQSWVPDTVSDAFATGQAISTTVGLIQLPFDVEMRDSPTAITVTTAATDFGLTRADSTLDAASAIAFSRATKRGIELNVTVAANLVAGAATSLRAVNTNGKILTTAEL